MAELSRQLRSLGKVIGLWEQDCYSFWILKDLGKILVVGKIVPRPALGQLAERCPPVASHLAHSSTAALTTDICLLMAANDMACVHFTYVPYERSFSRHPSVEEASSAYLPFTFAWFTGALVDHGTATAFPCAGLLGKYGWLLLLHMYIL